MTEPTWTFLCPACGNDGLTVEHEYTVASAYVMTVACTCGAAPDGIASERRIDTATRWLQSGPLDDEHRPDWQDNEKVDKLPDEEISYEVFCASCDAAATAADCETHEDTERTEDLKAGDQDNRFAVVCDGCTREVEFGWSHPERGGRIWPAECSDFNPWKSWPEPRFRDSWREKGWLRPGSAGPSTPRQAHQAR